MLDGNDTANTAGVGSYCYGAFAPLGSGGYGSQLEAAVAYLTANPGEVELITITIGANDILACSDGDPVCIATQLTKVGTNLPVILGTLRAAAPGATIVGMNYYNPNLAYWVTGPAGQALAAASLQLTEVGNGVIEAVYGAFGVPVADVESAFKTFETKGKTPKNVKEVCKLTLMCEKVKGDLVLSDYDPATPGPQTDIHPSDKGYKKIYDTFKKLLHKEKLLK
jgi:lysophospholipase L1-like esterase